MKPFLRWVGGKKWLTPTLVPKLAAAISPTGRYIEPFLGGGAIALALAECLPSAGFLLNDFSEPLVRTWQWVTRSPLSVDRELRKLAETGSDPAAYKVVRAAYNVERAHLAKAAQFLYLNATSFNGVYRENQKGLYNVPHGRTVSSFISTETLEAVSKLLLARTRFSCGDFEPLVAQAKAGDAVFADPPYDGVFGDYTAQGFSTADQGRLAAVLKRASDRGAAIYATNADTPLIRELYGWATVGVVAETRNVAASATARVKAECVLISNRKG
jgi:DNA adenine methylase